MQKRREMASFHCFQIEDMSSVMSPHWAYWTADCSCHFHRHLALGRAACPVSSGRQLQRFVTSDSFLIFDSEAVVVLEVAGMALGPCLGLIRWNRWNAMIVE